MHRGLFDAIEGRDGLPLHGHLNLITLYLLAQRRIEQVGIAAATGGRATTAIEEQHLDARLAGHAGQVFLRPVDSPVGHEITAVLGAIGEAQHHRLTRAALLQVRLIGDLRIDGSHRSTRALQVVDRLEQWHDIDS